MILVLAKVIWQLVEDINEIIIGLRTSECSPLFLPITTSRTARDMAVPKAMRYPLKPEYWPWPMPMTL